MNPTGERCRRWTRWLSARGLPPGHIARVLDTPETDVGHVLERVPRHALTFAQEAQVCGLRADGVPVASIALALGVCDMTIYGCLNRPPEPAAPTGPPAPDRGPRGVRGDTAIRIRRLRALGYEPGRVAELLALDLAEVIDFIERITPRGSAAGDELARPRTHREQSGRRPRRSRPYRPKGDDSWGPRVDDDDLVNVAPMEALEQDQAGDAPAIVAELVRAEPIVRKAVDEVWGPVNRAEPRPPIELAPPTPAEPRPPARPRTRRWGEKPGIDRRHMGADEDV